MTFQKIKFKESKYLLTVEKTNKNWPKFMGKPQGFDKNGECKKIVPKTKKKCEGDLWEIICKIMGCICILIYKNLY